MEKTKEGILSKILIKKEDTLNELEELVNAASKFIKVESESGEVFFASDKSLTNRDKIVLLLIGKYFAKELGLISNGALNLNEMSSQLNIAGTTLSKPVGQLVSDRIIRKEDDGKYLMIYHKIKDYLFAIKISK